MRTTSWQKFCIQAAIEALHPTGAVLELGFSGGFSTLEIQKYHPQSHRIIGSDPGNVEAAKKWVKKKGLSHILVDDEAGEGALAHTGVMDAIFALPLMVDESSEWGPPIVQEGTKLLREIEEMFPTLKKRRYTEGELEGFCREVAGTVPEALARFLGELEENGQIDAQQKKRLLRQFHLPRIECPPPKKQETVAPFLKRCLASHMRQGSRFVCCFSNATSKFEDRFFFEQIIPDINLNFREWVLESPTFRDRTALVIWIEKFL